jgi:acetylornithine deacetylase
MRLANQNDVQVTQGATDQQFFTRANIPAVICGPGEKSIIHAPNEYIEKSLLELCAARYAEIVTAWAT